MRANTPYTGIIIGGLIGLFFGGPVVALVGAILGYYLNLHAHKFIKRPAGWQNTVQMVFFKTTFKVLGHLAKADGRVSEREIAAARRIMANLGLNDKKKHEAIKFFNQGKQPDFNLEATIREFKLSCWFRPVLYRAFMDCLIQMAAADGRVSSKTQAILSHIARSLGVPLDHNRQKYQQYRSTSSESNYYGNNLQEAYTTLGITSKATTTEIKKAYRRQMNRHHPDKLIAKGVPEEMIKLATEKTQQIKQAFEKICAAKGIKR